MTTTTTATSSASWLCMRQPLMSVQRPHHFGGELGGWRARAYGFTTVSRLPNKHFLLADFTVTARQAARTERPTVVVAASCLSLMLWCAAALCGSVCGAEHVQDM